VDSILSVSKGAIKEVNKKDKKTDDLETFYSILYMTLFQSPSGEVKQRMQVSIENEEAPA
jgi:hypothetical protein